MRAGRSFAIAACAFGVGALAAFGCGNQGAPPPLENTNGDSGPIVPPDGGNARDGTAPVDGGNSSDAADGGTSADTGQADTGPPATPVCPTTFKWSTSGRIASIASAGFDRFGGITADELTVAWTDAAGAVFVADRASNAAAFGAPVQVDPGTTLANGRVAILPGGLALVATVANRTSFVSFVRQSRASAWQVGSATQFKNITAAARAEGSGALFSEPVASADGLSLFYLLTPPNKPPVLTESAWNQGFKTWDVGAQPSNAELANATATAAQARRPTGASDDGLTLFFFDGFAGKERGAWRVARGTGWTIFADLPGLPEGVPTTDCVNVYFHGSDSAGQGLFTGSGP